MFLGLLAMGDFLDFGHHHWTKIYQYLYEFSKKPDKWYQLPKICEKYYLAVQ